MLQKGENGHLIWNNEFKNYTNYFLNNSYQKIINNSLDAIV
jgi:hypothetical protein